MHLTAEKLGEDTAATENIAESTAAAGVGRAARDGAALGAGAAGVTAAAGWPASSDWSGSDGHGGGEDGGNGGELHFDGVEGLGFVLESKRVDERKWLSD